MKEAAEPQAAVAPAVAAPAPAGAVPAGAVGLVLGMQSSTATRTSRACSRSSARPR